MLLNKTLSNTVYYFDKKFENFAEVEGEAGGRPLQSISLKALSMVLQSSACHRWLCSGSYIL